MPTLYGTSIPDIALSTACQMATTSGGTETSKTTTIANTSNTYAECQSQGGTGSSFSSLPSPTGHGWVWYPGAGTVASGNWSAIITKSSVSRGTSTIVRSYKISGGIYTAISSITVSNTSTAKTTYNFANTAMSSVTTASGDGIYFDVFHFDNNANTGGDNPTIYMSTSASAGVTNDMQITLPAFTPAATTISRTVPATAALLATNARTVNNVVVALQATRSKIMSSKVALLKTNTRTVNAATALLSTNNRTIPASAALSNTSRIIPISAALLGTLARTMPATAALLKTGNTRTIPIETTLSLTQSRVISHVTAALDLPSSRTIPVSAALWGTLTRTIHVTGSLSLAQHRTISSVRAALLHTQSRIIPVNTALAITSSRTVPASAALTGTRSRTISANAALTNSIIRVVPIKAALSQANIARTIPTTAALSVEITSGGFGVFANGTGTASFDHLRITQYPDPALNLAPVLPRLGNSTVSWDEVVPTGGSRTIKTSLDGVNWTDVSSGNGDSIPGLTGQPDPVIDWFDEDSSTDYTATSIADGSVASILYEPDDSRISLSGGSSALYLYSAVSDDDIELITDMDYSDAGGLVWRYVDANNFYELAVYDDSSTSGFTNQLRLYKVASGTRTLLGSPSSIVWSRSTRGRSPYKRIRVTMLSDTITIYFDGVQKQQYTDGSPLASGKCGFRNDGGTSRYYQFRMQQIGDYVSGTPAGDIATSQFLYTQISLSTTDPAINPQIQDLTTSAYSPSISRGKIVPQLHDPSKPFATPYNQEMDTLVSDSGDYYWDVAGGQLIFAARHTTPAPWCVHSSDMLFTPNVRPTNSADQYRNRQNITNCIDTIDVTGEQKIADGTASSWQLAYPVYSAPTITVQGVAKTVGKQGVDTGKDFYWQPASASISQDSSAARIPSGYVLSFDYTGQFYRTVTRDNLAEQGRRRLVEKGTSGIVEMTEDGKGMLASAAETYADGLLERFANNNTVEIAFSTHRSGLAKGQVSSFFVDEFHLNDRQMLITKVTIIGEQKSDGTILYEYQITATDGVVSNPWQTLSLKK